MKPTTYTGSFLTLAALFARQALAQTPLSGETNQVCGFTLSSDGNAIVRTNDWNLARNNGDAALTQASFWLTGTPSSRLYGSNGQRCGFDPYLECDSDDNDSDQDNTPFTISTTGTLSFTGQSTFYLCARNAFTEFDDDDGTVESTNEDDLQTYPYIYPPTGTTNNAARNYQNCTQVTLIADRCFEGSNEYTVAPNAAVSSSTNLPSQTATGTGSVTGATGTASSVAASGTSAAATSASGAAASATGAAERVSFDGRMMSGLVGVAALMFAL